MIKDKITPELKKRFRQEINNSKKDGKEHGFLLCSDKKEKLYATTSIVGEEDNLFFKPLKNQCKSKIQGEFHTHPRAMTAKKFFDNQLGRDLPIEEVRNGLIDAVKKRNISLTEPSYGDILGTMILNHKNEMLGTTCIGTDIYPEKIECWSTKDHINKIDYDKAVEDLNSPATISNPLKWVRPLFNRETINI